MSKINSELAMLLRGHTPSSAQYLVQNGRVSQAAYDRYIVTWQWSAWRFNDRFSRAYRARGADAMDARIERCTGRLNRFLAAQAQEVQ